MDHSLTLPAPAKLNLFLHITGRRTDGYHELQSVFQLLDYGDELAFTLTDTDAIEIGPPIPGIPTHENLIYKAAELMRPYQNVLKGVQIQLVKHLPMGGGLGGGSSDAATTLLALNHLWKCKLPLSKLQEIGLKLGADVPVFVHGKTAWAEGIGEELKPVKTPDSWYLILVPDTHISTAQIFSNEVLTRDTPKIKIAPALEGQALDALHNDCEPVVSMLYPDVKEAISWLKQFGKARLTGTGACCFCRFESEAKARQVLNEASSKFKGFIAKGVHLSPAHLRLDEAQAFAMNSQH